MNNLQLKKAKQHLIKMLLLTFLCPYFSYAQLKIYPAPAGAQLNNSFKVFANNLPVPVYNFKVNPKNLALRQKALADLIHCGDYYENASFAYFDMNVSTSIKITNGSKIRTARILPSSAAIISTISNNTLTFTIAKPGNIVVEINGEEVRSLQIFANPLVVNAPNPGDPNVIYYGPGIHYISSLTVGDNKTVYLAGGAILKAVINPAESFTSSSRDGLRSYAPVINLTGKNIKFMGRGIIDGSACPVHSRELIQIKGEHIEVRGIIIQDGPTWNVQIRRSKGVLINNVKILGYRANSDGVDICNSRNVNVSNSYIRTNDDLVVVKTDDGPDGVNNVRVEGCLLWNQLARALSIGAEIIQPVNNVLFSNCDIIHDKGIEWSMGIDHSDSATVSNVRFEHIRVEEAHRLISVWIGKSQWSTNKESGHIKNITFENIHAKGSPLTIEVKGADQTHLVQNVVFKDVTLNGKLLRQSVLSLNDFTRDIIVNPK